MQKFFERFFWATGVVACFGGMWRQQAIAQPISSIINPADTCFMVSSTGKRIDLGHLCTKNPQIIPKPKPKPKPKPVQKNISNTPTSNFSSSANIKAFLMVIRYAEGTDSQDGYQIQYTGSRFYDFVDHPRRARCGNIAVNLYARLRQVRINF